MKTKILAFALTLMSFTIAYGNNPVQIQKTSNPAIFKLTYVGSNSDPVVVKSPMNRVWLVKRVFVRKSFDFSNFERSLEILVK